MVKTEINVIENIESLLIDAMTTCNLEVLHKLLHQDVIMTSENGEVFIGVKKLHINEPSLLKIKTLEIKERSISFFNTVAVVNSYENRTGEYLGLYFEREFRVTRVWKNYNNNWKLIVASLVMLP